LTTPPIQAGDQDLPLLCHFNGSHEECIVYMCLSQRNEPRRGEVSHRIYETDQTFLPTTLDKRGWCFQERLLARRILHCGLSELPWGCQASTSCECQTQWTGSTEMARWKSEFVADVNWNLDSVDPYQDRFASGQNS